MDEEELQKRFTDCVYFLASPLTCKKGIECEYRHSEMARLNPRDCWYWLGGCCFNPDCAFRHPPLEGLKEAYHESVNPNNGPALPVDKTNVPCYFFSQGFCNKGDKCPFLHGPADGYKSAKAVSTVNNAAPPEKKLSAGSNTRSTPVESHPDPSETAQIEQTQQLASGSAENGESSEDTVVSSDSSIPLEEVGHNNSDVYKDLISDQKAYGYVEREGWLESSPAFDVLIKGESERLCYEKDGADYFSVHDEVRMELDVQHADPIEYHQLREKSYDVYERLDKISGQSRGSIFYRLSFQKRNELAVPIYSSRRRGTDLRDLLKKRKVVDFKGYNIDHRIRRNPARHGSHGEVDFAYRGKIWKTVPVNKYRQPLRTPRFFSAEVSRSRKPALKPSRKSREESAIFTGPKTLEQIKEEKKKAQLNRDLGSFNQTESNGFQGPRSLSEILKNKSKLG